MEQFLPVIIACIGALIALASFILGASGIIGFNGFKRDYEAESADLIRASDKLRQELLDLKDACTILGGRIRTQEQEIKELNARLDELSLTTQDADSKLYTRAKKMIDLGADISEVVRECEIPQGEAELLFRVKGKPVKSAPTVAAPELKPVPSSIPGVPTMESASKMPDFGGMTGISSRVMQADRDVAMRRDNGAALSSNQGSAGVGDTATQEGGNQPLPKEASGLMEHFKNMQRP